MKTSIQKKTARARTSKQKKIPLLHRLRSRGFVKPAVFVVVFVLIGGATLGWISAATTTYGFWDGSVTPKLITEDNTEGLELGMKFRPMVAGYITGVRFYKSAQNTGTHTGSLWNANGRLLATVTFKNETKSGWQQAVFDTPVSVGANMVYVISYHAPKGHFSVDRNYFNRGEVRRNSLVAVRASKGSANGVFKFSSQTSYPTSNGDGANYWVDVLFNTKLVKAPVAPAAPSNLVATPATGEVSLSWRASASAYPISGYEVYRNGAKIASTAHTNYKDANVKADTTYQYQVRAFDTKNAMSALTAQVSVKVPAVSVPTPRSAENLFNPSKKEIAMQLVSSAENSSLNWKAQYGYIEDIKDGRGYTAGIIGFCSGCGDMAQLVAAYNVLHPGNALSKYYSALVSLGSAESASHAALDPNFMKDWKAAAADPLFQKAQDNERDRVYFNPSVSQAIADGLNALGQFAYYDAMVMHGPGSDPVSFGGIRAAALKKAKTPAQGGDEVAYINAFLDARKAAMLTEEAHKDTDRVDTAQRVFLTAGNLSLDAPLKWTMYGDSYMIAKNP